MDLMIIAQMKSKVEKVGILKHQLREKQEVTL